MEQYIKKSDIVAELEKIKKEWAFFGKPGLSAVKALNDMLSFLDTLEVEEVEVPVSKDLEEAADKHLVEKGYLLTTNNGEHLAEVEAKGLFKAGALWQKQQLIDKACEWINLHIGELSDIYSRSAIRNEFLEDFRQAMEEEL